MAYNYEYPYDNAAQYNDDWLINQVKQLTEEWSQVQTDWNNQQEAFDSLKNYINNYFNNLDVSQEVSDKINSMVSSGDLLDIIEPVIPDLVSKWLADNVTATEPPIDKSLTISGAGADAKVVGDIAYLYRDLIPTGTTKLSDIRKLGTYGIDSSQIALLTDLPNGFTGAATVANILGYNGQNITQKLWKTGTVNNPYFRTINIQNNIVGGWMLETYDNFYQYRDLIPTGTTKLSDIRKLGTYGIDSSQIALLTDLPNGFTGAATVANILGYNGQNITQKLWKTGTVNNPYFRTINIQNGTVGSWAMYGGYLSALTNKKWLALGDSFTAGDFTGVDVPRIGWGLYATSVAVYPAWIGTRTNCIVTNRAIGGLRIGGNNGFANNYLNYITNEYDYITLQFGINDLPDHQNTPLGSINDNTIDTFYGAWNVVMNKIFTINPTAHIGIIVTNGILPSYSDYVNAIIEIAEYWCVPYLNMANGVQVPTMCRSAKTGNKFNPQALSARDNAFKVSSSNAHPNAKAHEYESVFIEQWLLTI